jgi:hypothetical protein
MIYHRSLGAGQIAGRSWPQRKWRPMKADEAQLISKGNPVRSQLICSLGSWFLKTVTNLSPSWPAKPPKKTLVRQHNWHCEVICLRLLVQWVSKPWTFLMDISLRCAVSECFGFRHDARSTGRCDWQGQQQRFRADRSNCRTHRICWVVSQRIATPILYIMHIIYIYTYVSSMHRIGDTTKWPLFGKILRNRWIL